MRSQDRFGLRRSSFRVARVIAPGAVMAMAAMAPTAAGQGQWSATEGVSGASPAVYAATQWDPDGNGPKAPLVVLAGEFDAAGGMPTANIATWDGAVWGTLGAGLSGSWVDSLAVLADGSLVASGSFSNSGGVSVSNIARWDGTQWQPLGTGMNNEVTSVSAGPNGDLYAGGFFSTAGGVPANRIARWNGGTWSPMGSGADNMVWSVLAMPSGDVLIGGQFFSAGGVHVNNLARWDGAAWHAMGGANAPVLSLTRLPDGNVIVGGQFTLIGNAQAAHIARFDGTNWFPFGAGVKGTVWTAATLPNGDMVAGGVFLMAGGVPANFIARWNGSAWSALGAGTDGGVFALLPRGGGETIVGGAFANAGGQFSPGLARYTEGTCPADPTNLKTAELVKGVATLNWTDNAVNETGYRVKREQYLQGTWKNGTIVATLGANATSYSQSPGQGFWRYEVQAFNAGCDSAWTALVPVAPAVPGGLAAANVGGQVNVTWTDSSDFENKFLLQRQQKVGNKWTNLVKVATPAKNAAAYTDSPGVGTWRYRIRSTSVAGNSAFTPWVSVTLP